MSTRIASHLGASLRAALAGSLLLSAAACTTTAPRRDVVFPPPPELGRIQWIRTYNSQRDLDQGWFTRFMEVLVPRARNSSLSTPYGLALSPDERTLYVASTGSSRLVAIDLEAGTFRAFEPPEGVPMTRPLGVAVDAAGNVYVSDRLSSSILVFDSDRKYQRRITNERLYAPASITIDRPAQLLYVVNDPERKTGAHSIEIFSLKGDHLRTLGGGVSDAEGKFYMPQGVAISPAGEVFVTDKLNFRVQIFDREGRYLRSFGQQGLGGPGNFDKIHGIAFDSFGDVYVVDALQGVQMLNDLQQPLMAFNNGIMDLPLFIAISSKNRIYISDFAMQVIHEFQLINTTAGDNRRRAPAPATDAGGPAAPK